MNSQAGVAQLVEQRIRNARVAGSTPVAGSTHNGTGYTYPQLLTTVPGTGF